MKTRPAKPLPVPPTKAQHKKHPAAPAPNAALNQQNRRVLAQHYRAKYGVK
jgi:predicted component of type VI protein secretion system